MILCTFDDHGRGGAFKTKFAQFQKIKANFCGRGELLRSRSIHSHLPLFKIKANHFYLRAFFIFALSKIRPLFNIFQGHFFNFRSIALFKDQEKISKPRSRRKSGNHFKAQDQPLTLYQNQ